MDKDTKEYGYMTGNRDVYPILKENSRNNRNSPTMAEDMLWECIRKKALGWKFRRQHPINDFIADFVCLEKKLVIEVDGGYHDNEEQRKDDEERSLILNRLGFYVARFRNEQIINEPEFVITRIKEILDSIEI